MDLQTNSDVTVGGNMIHTDTLPIQHTEMHNLQGNLSYLYSQWNSSEDYFTATPAFMDIKNVNQLGMKKSRKKSSKKQCITFNFVVYGMVVGTFCFLGLSGNTLSIFVLHKDKSNEVASFLLQALAVADNLVLIISLTALSVIYGIIPLAQGLKAIVPLRPYIVVFVHPIGYMTQTLSIWMTVLLAINRYIAVCMPFHATTLCTMKNARYQVGSVLLFSIIFNFPRFFQFHLITKSYQLANGEMIKFVSINDTIIGERTLFGNIYTNALYSICIFVVPFISLAYLNTRLALELKNMRKRRNSMSTTPAPSDQNITFVMIIIIVIFIICHLPDRILQGTKSFWNPKATGCYSAFQNYTAVANVLITLNSSTNFLVYYFFRKRFRRILGCLCCKEKSNNRTYRLGSLSTNGLHQITLMSSLGTVDLNSSRMSLHRLSHSATDRDTVINILKANSALNMYRLSNNIAVREKLLIPATAQNRYSRRNSQ